VLQPVPRRLFRYLVMTNEAARIWMGREVMRLRGALCLPELLDHVDGLIADGTIGGTDPNAADFQILAGVRVLLEFEDVAQLLEGRASAPVARRLYPDWAGPIPRGLPRLS
jgi:glutathione S-transferase